MMYEQHIKKITHLKDWHASPIYFYNKFTSQFSVCILTNFLF